VKDRETGDVSCRDFLAPFFCVVQEFGSHAEAVLNQFFRSF
jgi:hypothetical protein